MNLTGLFVRRPVMTTLLMIGILVFGIVSYRRLPVSDLPTVDYPTINVNANLHWRESLWTMAATVATPLEKAFSAIAGIDEITSNSSLGGTNVTLQFSLDRDVEAAAQDVNAAIGKTLPFLPSTILPPNYHKQNPASSPILNIALTSNVMPLTQVDESRGNDDRTATVDGSEGVATVGVYGAAKYAVRVQLDLWRARVEKHRRVAGSDGDSQQQRDVADRRVVRKGQDADAAGDWADEQRFGISEADHRVQEWRCSTAWRRGERP